MPFEKVARVVGDCMGHLFYPGVVVGGAPKCGTTSLYDSLRGHAGINCSITKEPFFLMDQDSWVINKNLNIHKDGPESYRKVWKNVDDRLTLEASTMYLYQDTALSFFSQKEVKSKIVFVLRDPVDRYISNYNYFKNNKGYDLPSDVMDFYDTDKSTVDWSDNEQLANAFEHGEYSRYLERWYEALGEERILLVNFKDLVLDHEAVISDVCSFINVNEDLISTVAGSVSNPTISPKSEMVHKASRFMSKFLPDGKFRSKVKSTYIKFNGSKKMSSNVLLDFEKYLASKYVSSNDWLKGRGIDTSSWKRP